MQDRNSIGTLIRSMLPAAEADWALHTVAIDATLADYGANVTRAAFAMALNVALFHDLMQRVPSGSAYVAGICGRGDTVCFDHGALRTIRFPDRSTGALPAGAAAFARILEPLGYNVAGVYPLPRLRMTGYAYAHADKPETIPQFFVSELHVDQFDDAFGQAADRVFGGTADPLDAAARGVLARFAAGDTVPVEVAAPAFASVLAAFGRHHGPFTIADYDLLRGRSAEAAWIATEGNAFNHAANRVDDVEALADELRAAGHLIKERVEVSGSGRVRQTALRADQVEREFVGADGQAVVRTVPGSFYEFISRDDDPATGKLDLAFDSANATGIFAMTKAAS